MFAILSLLAVVLIFGNPRRFRRYLVRDGAYVGHALVKRQRSVAPVLGAVLADQDYSDFRRPAPDFSRPAAAQLRAPHSAAELARYARFLAQWRTDKAAAQGDIAVARLVVARLGAAYRGNRASPRRIDDGILGSNTSRAEDYLFYAVNANTSCGTLGEAAVGLLRDAGLHARLVLMAVDDRHLQADHVSAEFYSRQQHRWMLADVMSGVVGESAFAILADPSRWRRDDALLGGPYFSARSAIWFDQRGPVRTRFVMTGADGLRQADGAPHRAKRDGRNRVVTAD